MWKIAIIDDDPNLLDGMREAIPWADLNIQWVGEGLDGEEGLDLVKELKPDIVITDISMPVMNGLEMIERLREQDYKGRIVILSGYSDFEYARQALRLNVDDYLSKPVTVNNLKKVIERVTRKLEEDKQLRKDTGQELDEIRDVAEIRHVQFYRQLAGAIRNAQEEQAKALIASYTSQLESLSKRELRILANDLWAVIAYSLLDIGIDLKQIYPSFEPMPDADGSYSPATLQLWLEDMVATILNSKLMSDNVKHRKIVEFVIRYIHEHYMEDLTLGTLADEVQISKNYLGQIFKNVMQEPFNHYVTRVRMEKAKDMILEGKMYVYEVAEKVGYNSISYFSTQFKKYTGYNPTDLIN